MDLGLNGRVAIVAAASQGLGKAVAQTLMTEGATVAVCARNADALKKIGAAYYEAINVTDESAVQDFVDQVYARFGRIDICVANAGGPPSKKFDQTTTDEWHAAVDLNLMSTLHFARYVLPKMREHQWGRFIAITSVSVKQPLDNLILSNSVRAAVAGLVKSLANEYGVDGITVNNACPGFTATDRLTNLAAKLAETEKVPVADIVARWANQTAVKRVGTPEDFAAVVAFLASERAGYITGASLSIDGGLAKGIFS